MHIRPIGLPDDRAALEALDTSFEASEAYAVEPTAEGFSVRLERVAPFVKAFPLDDLDAPAWHAAWGAVADSGLAGFAAVRFEAWNRRLVIWHLYVDSRSRRRGLATALVGQALAYGRMLGAAAAWLEVSNRNAPAVAAYRAMGFALCGLDTSLYAATPARGEIALFMARPLDDGCARA